MSNADIRAAVDHAIRRHLEARAPSPPPAPAAARGTPELPPPARDASPPGHPSHARFTVADGAASGGPCVIEPAVVCIHCGHCQTQGY